LRLSSAGRSSYGVSSWLFLRLLGLAYLFAFWSLALQLHGLIGHHGILPAADYMKGVASFADSHRIGASRYVLWPTLCWFGASDRFLSSLALGGVGLAAMLTAGLLPAAVLPLLWVSYLSLSVVCRDFLSFQWDVLLLETGLLAVFIAPIRLRDRLSDAGDPPRLARWLLWWLLFRLMLGSGIVKLASGDPAWRGLTALIAHYETQPIPTPLAWYVSRLPDWFHQATTAAVLAVELAVPWLIPGPRRVRSLACGVFIALQVLIALTGNYAFFNLLTIALCVLLLDDRSLGWLSRSAVPDAATRRSAVTREWLTAVVGVVTVPVSIVMLAGQAGMAPPGSSLVSPLSALVEPFRSVNSYGLFAVMTTSRPEIVVEGSLDGDTWLPYEFKDKPGDVRGALPWVAPFQPRLDWQMWFAALSEYDREPWFEAFCARLLEASPPVLELLKTHPFEGRPPRFVRAVLYRYRFASWPARRASGVVWERERLGLYLPGVSLQPSSHGGR
jgi:hypothetical protein